MEHFFWKTVLPSRIEWNCNIRKGCTILQQVTIGVTSLEKPGAPVIGDRVFIGAGAKVIGKIIIGDDVKIGANAVVVSDVPSGATVVGNPARIIEKGENKSK